MFKFSFGDSNDHENNHTEEQIDTSLLPAETVSIDQLKSRAPRISYTKDKFGIPRRDLFDVRFELMSQDNLTEEESLLLGIEDVRKNVYEGGLKVWEGAYDLLDLISEKNFAAQNVIELGCGAGIPISYLFYQLIKSGKPGRFVLADYNPAVLKLLTMPNLVLSWLAAVDHEHVQDEHNEVTLEKGLVEAMEADLEHRGIKVEFVSGAWSSKFSDLVGSSFDLVLASETIYSPEAVPAFSDVVKRALTNGVALVAAKKIYFGVGGDVVEFERLLDERDMIHNVVFEKGSVGRVVLEVKHKDH